MRATIGIDIGTSAVKAVAVGFDGQVLARANRPYPTRTPAPAFVEQSPDDWWTATVAASRAVLAEAGTASIEGVGLSGQLNGFVLLGDDGRPLADAPIWLDTRAVAETAELARGFGAELTERAVTEINPIAVVTKLLWISRHRPELARRTKRILLVKDYVLLKLTGIVATDPSDASATAMMDAETQEWIGALCQGAGFDPALLPPIRPSTEIVGRVSAAAAAETGIAEGTPVVPGGGDVTALAVGCGVAQKGVLGVTLGTAGHVVLSEDRLPKDALGRGIWHLPHAEPGKTIWLGLVMAGGLSLAWLHKVFGADGKTGLGFEDMVALCEAVPAGARGVTFVPFLEGAATPYGAPLARAGFHGLSSSHGAAEMVQAAMEGVAFNVRQCVDLFRRLDGTISEVRIAEGGARVQRWCQIVADVLACPVRRIEELDASAVGAALMAQVGVGGETLQAVIDRSVRLGGQFLPSPGTVEAYDAAYRRYLSLADAEAARSRRAPGES